MVVTSKISVNIIQLSEHPVHREGLLPCRVSSKMKIRLALDQFSLPPSPSADFHFATLSALQYFFPANYYQERSRRVEKMSHPVVPSRQMKPKSLMGSGHGLNGTPSRHVLSSSYNPMRPSAASDRCAASELKSEFIRKVSKSQVNRHDTVLGDHGCTSPPLGNRGE